MASPRQAADAQHHRGIRYWLTVVGLAVVILAAWYPPIQAVTCTSGGSSTAVLTLCKPAAGTTGWATAINDNWDAIDALFTGTGQLKTANGGTSLSSAGTSGNCLVSNGTNWTSDACGTMLFSIIDIANAPTMTNGQFTNFGLSDPVGASSSKAAENNAVMVMPKAGVAKNFYVRNDAAGGTGCTLTIRKNGANTAVTVAVGGTASTTYSDTTNSVSFAAGDRMSIGISGGTNCDAVESMTLQY